MTTLIQLNALMLMKYWNHFVLIYLPLINMKVFMGNLNK